MPRLGLGLSITRGGLINNVGGAPPVNTTSPVLSGIPLVGETLTSTQGTWSGTPPISYTYVFLSTTDFVNFTVLQSSTSPTYVIQSADSGKLIRCNVNASNSFGSGGSSSNYLAIASADLVNLQSYDASKFTLVGSKISVWADQDNTKSTWVQTLDARRPTLTSGVPIFPGSGSFMQRNSGELSLTTFSAYIVLQNAGKTNQAGVFSGITAGSWMDMGNMWQSYASRANFRTGHTGNRRVVLTFKRDGATVEVWYNDRKVITSSSWSGQASLIGNIMGLSWNNGWSINGACQSAVVSSAFHSDAQTQDIVSGLYNQYNLASETAIDSIVGIGDSNTVGSGTNSYLVALSTNKALSFTNLGISGCYLTPLGGTVANSVYARYMTQLESRPKTDWIILCAGTNDISLGSVSSANYELYLNEIINELVNTYQYQANRIIICSPPYQRDGANAASLVAYNNVCSSIATTYGTQYFDLYSAILNGGGNSLLSDNLHLNASGQTIWTNGVGALM